MARNGSPDDPDNHWDSEPTQYANYGGAGGEAYSEYDEPVAFGPPTGHVTGPGQYPPEPPTPWYRKPAALVGLGVLTAIVLALLVYAIVKFTGNDATSPAGTSTTSSTTTGVAPSPSVAPVPGETTQTVTASPATTSAAPTTTEAPTTTTTTEAPSTSTSTSTTTSTSVSVSTSVSTITETITTTQRLLPTLFPRPGGQ